MKCWCEVWNIHTTNLYNHAHTRKKASIVYQRRLLLISSLFMVLYTEISDQTFLYIFSSRFWSIKSFKTLSECESRIVGRSPNFVTKSDSGITRHLKTTPECRKAVGASPEKRFKVSQRRETLGTRVSWRLFTFLVFHLSCVRKKNLYEV